MGHRSGEIIDLKDGLAIVRVTVGAGELRRQRLVFVPLHVLAAPARGQIIDVEIADWEFDRRVLRVCLPPLLLALAGGLLCAWLGVAATAVGVVAGATLGGLWAALTVRQLNRAEQLTAQARPAPCRVPETCTRPTPPRTKAELVSWGPARRSQAVLSTPRMRPTSAASTPRV